MITKAEWQTLIDTDKIKTKIEDHMTKALAAIIGVHGGELGTWYYYGAASGNMGEMIIRGDSIGIEVELDKYIKSEVEYEDEHYSGYLTCSFPVHFLFMSISDIVVTVSKYKANAEKKAETAKKKMAKTAKASKTKKDKLVASARSKLTPEEKKAIGIK